MSTATVVPQTLTPALMPLHTGGVQHQDLIKCRYVFSPRLTLDVRGEKCRMNYIDGGRITLVDNYPYPDRTAQWGGNSDVPDWKMWDRYAGHIVAGFLRENGRDGDTDTGFCELDALIGLDPGVQGDLIVDLQMTILPVKHKTGQSMVDWLESAEVVGAVARKPPSVRSYYERTHAQILGAAKQSILHARARKEQIAESISQAALNKKGFSAKIGRAEEEVFIWLGEEVPAIINPSLQARNAPLDVAALGAAIAAGLNQAQASAPVPTAPVDTAAIIAATIQGLLDAGAIQVVKAEAVPTVPTIQGLSQNSTPAPAEAVTEEAPRARRTRTLEEKKADGQ